MLQRTVDSFTGLANLDRLRSRFFFRRPTWRLPDVFGGLVSLSFFKALTITGFNFF